MNDRTTLKDINDEIWNRLLVDLPHIYKSKGTIKSIRSIINIFGIPASILDVKEYSEVSDTKNELYNDYQLETFVHALNFYGEQTLNIPWHSSSNNTFPSGIELFFRAEEIPATSSLININDKIKVELIKSSTTDGYGYFQVSFDTGSGDWITTGSNEFRIENEEANHIVLQRIGSGSFQLNYANLLYSDLLIKNNSILDDETVLYLPSGSTNYWDVETTASIGYGFSGSIYELRLWGNTIEDYALDNHTRYPQSVISNTVSSSFDDLYLHYSFNNPKNHNTGSTHTALENEAYNDSLYSLTGVGFVNWPSESVFPFNYRGFTIDTLARYVDSGVMSITSNKVRVDDNYILSGSYLNPHTSVDYSTYKDKIEPTDLGIYFSPTNLINEDIIRHVGLTDIGELIGDPRDQYEDTYSEIDILRKMYWKWGATKPSFSDYLYYLKTYDLKGLFSSIENMLPARSYPYVGILYEQTLLERNKIKKKRPTARFEQLDMSIIQHIDTTVSSSVKDLSYTLNIKENNGDYNSNFEKIDIYNILAVYENTNISGSLNNTINIRQAVDFENNIIYQNFKDGGESYSQNQQFDSYYPLTHYARWKGNLEYEQRLKYKGCLNNVNTTIDKVEPVIVTVVDSSQLYSDESGDSNLGINL